MADYHVIAADGSASFGTFDKYKPARELHEKLSRKRSCNLLSLHGCGCVYRALCNGDRHVGWRRSESCAEHVRALPINKNHLVDGVPAPEKTIDEGVK